MRKKKERLRDSFHGFKFQRVQNFAFVASRHLSRWLKINHQHEGKHLREEKK